MMRKKNFFQFLKGNFAKKSFFSANMPFVGLFDRLAEEGFEFIFNLI